MKRATLLLFFTTALFTACTQLTLKDQLKKHISYLASDELEGREAGTDGEEKAAIYVADQFAMIGLEPKGTDGFFQSFDFVNGKNYGDNQFIVDGEARVIDDQYFPLNYSANGSATGPLVDAGFGIKATDLGYDDFEGKEIDGAVLVISVSSPDGIHPHSKYLAYHSLKDRVRTAASLGAAAVIFTNSDPTASDPSKRYTEKMAREEIPVIFSSQDITGSEATVKVELLEDERQAMNVVGFIDNQSETTAIFGAHFDHLGYGKSGGSLYRGDQESIHNGADDNASGTAMLIELARSIKESQLTNSNFLFIAFSGEEKGLLGANYYTKNPTIDLNSANYMINMDMVGRLDTTDYALAINGAGTSPAWKEIIESQTIEPLQVATSDSGVGPSDHTSFYLAEMPVLHFFTGTHENYHKPTDDEPLINYDGMETVHTMIMGIATELNAREKLAFTKTQDSNSRSAPRFNVTLGIVPDYMYDKGGVKVDGVSEGKPGSEAGLTKGDIVLRLGEYETKDMYGYMEALSKLKKGDKVEAAVKRGEETVTLEIQF